MPAYTSQPLLRATRTHSPYFRVDLIFDSVDHSGPSYEARIFLNNPQASEQTPKTSDAGYAGSFYIFGHGGCFGDEGHCDLPLYPRPRYDHRGPHPLTPQVKIVTITEAIERLEAAEFTVSVVPALFDPGDLPVGGDRENPLKFAAVRAVTYE